MSNTIQLLLNLEDPTGDDCTADRVVIQIAPDLATELLNYRAAYSAAAEIVGETPFALSVEGEDLNSLVPLVAFYGEFGDGEPVEEISTTHASLNVEYIEGVFRLDDEADRAEVISVSFLIDAEGITLIVATPDGDAVSDPIKHDALSAIAAGYFL